MPPQHRLGIFSGPSGFVPHFIGRFGGPAQPVSGQQALDGDQVFFWDIVGKQLEKFQLNITKGLLQRRHGVEIFLKEENKAFSHITQKAFLGSGDQLAF
jgi:hypothetical protein